jgi:hypothetical protein
MPIISKNLYDLNGSFVNNVLQSVIVSVQTSLVESPDYVPQGTQGESKSNSS